METTAGINGTLGTLAREQEEGTSTLNDEELQRIASFKDILLAEAQRRRKQHRPNPKNTCGWSRRSRKRKGQKLRAPSRSSRQVYHASTAAAQELKMFMQRPHIQEALSSLRRQRSEKSNCYLEPNSAAGDLKKHTTTAVHPFSGKAFPAPVESSSSIAADCRGTKICHLEEVEWPASVKKLNRSINPEFASERVIFRDIVVVGKCGCSEQCYLDECSSSKASLYCATKNCSLGGSCGNAFGNENDLALFRARFGIGVYTKKRVEAGVIVAEYRGEVCAYDGIFKDNPDLSKVKQSTGYFMLLRPDQTWPFRVCGGC